MAGRLEGKVAFITGAARGQGRSHAIRLAEEGADIIAIDLCKDIDTVSFPLATPADLDETIAKVEAVGRRILAVEVDVRDLDTMQKVVDDGVALFGRLDIVLGNAGIGSAGGVLHEMEPQAWKDMIDVNLTGVWHTVRAAVPAVIAGGRGGSIVLTASTGAIKGHPNVGHYVAAKHGVVGLMRSLAAELAGHDIRVNCVAPTQVNSPMVMNDPTFRLFRPDLEDPTVDDFAPASQATHMLPFPWVETVDISNAIVFLSSEEGRYITSHVLPIDLGALGK